MTVEVGNPFPLFLNARGDLLDGGYIYIGDPDENPETSPKACFWDEDLTIAASQPLRTRGGYIVNGAAPARVYTAGDDYSIRTKDSDGSTVHSVATIKIDATAYQPLDSDLTAIAALATTSFGRNLLILADAAALRSAAGIVSSLPLTGGTVTGNITRSSAGPHLYWADSGMASGRVFQTDNGAADPTSLDGDIWLEKVP